MHKSLLTGLLVLAFAGYSSAAVISVNFGKNGHAMSSSSQIAGVVPEDNWNSFTNQGSAISLTNAPLTDGDGNTNVATLSASGGGNPFNNQPAFSDGDKRMMNGLANSGTYTVSGLSSDFTDLGYDVYVYVAHDSRVGNVLQVNLTPAGGSSITLWGEQANPAFIAVQSPTYIDATQATKDDAFASNGGYYIRFEGLTASEFSFSGQYWTNPGSVTSAAYPGFQIVAVPEPASIALLATGGLCLLKRQRKSASGGLPRRRR
jgi:hypothetical protein